jgi:fimbrial chaperone protein
VNAFRKPRQGGVPALRANASWHALALLALFTAFAPLPAVAGEYIVSPMRINLDRDAKSAVVTLTNSGSDPMTFQIAAMEWTQDADGRDRYAQTGEVIFFPKILTLPPGESRVVRVGVQAIPASSERTFRLFVEPLPQPAREPLAPGANISVNLRFALPIFVKPPTRTGAGEIDDAALRKGVLTLTLRNTGNEHLRMDDGVAVSGLDAQGNEVFADRIDSRYVLAGMAKPVSLSIPKGACARIATVEITARAEQVTFRRKLDVDRTSCE